MQLKLIDWKNTRIETRKRELGEGGLRKLAQQLEDAKAENDRPIPQEVIDRFRIPGVESIHFIPTTVRAGISLNMRRVNS